MKQWISNLGMRYSLQNPTPKIPRKESLPIPRYYNRNSLDAYRSINRSSHPSLIIEDYHQKGPVGQLLSKSPNHSSKNRPDRQKGSGTSVQISCDELYRLKKIVDKAFKGERGDRGKTEGSQMSLPKLEMKSREELIDPPKLNFRKIFPTNLESRGKMIKAARLKDFKLKKRLDRMKRQHTLQPIGDSQKVRKSVQKKTIWRKQDESLEGWANQEECVQQEMRQVWDS